MRTKHPIKQPNKGPSAQMPPPTAHLRGRLFWRTKKKKKKKKKKEKVRDSATGGGRDPPQWPDLSAVTTVGSGRDPALGHLLWQV
jgi:hypothetical protein